MTNYVNLEAMSMNDSYMTIMQVLSTMLFQYNEIYKLLAQFLSLILDKLGYAYLYKKSLISVQRKGEDQGGSQGHLMPIDIIFNSQEILMSIKPQFVDSNQCLDTRLFFKRSPQFGFEILCNLDIWSKYVDEKIDHMIFQAHPCN